uniref:RNA-directed DNA polymerase, eukaryota, reverse transcriptase zinc-binding domain protein n=1 Tax=Tanacetum cinerariifolium TaxID=118510 RepID=A0A699J0P6_TANCI|nr:RNA-directed DNA polymerase, eukaryota, reverse transcriptase zinc-binding domain protein [Tanacetum cinerariifolium]
MVSDHSPAVLVIPNGLPRKKKSFRFVNYVADKIDFLDVVQQGWNLDIKGCHIFKVVKRLKNLKKALNELNWKNDNLFDKVVVLKQQLKEAQSNLEANPFNLNKRREAMENFSKYTEAIEDELKLLHKTAKIKWLREGDNNYVFFYSVLKSRKNKNRVESICGENMDRFMGNKLYLEDTAKMIVKVTDVEIKSAMFDIDSNKAAGPMDLLHVCGYFKGDRGLRQGDQISPYLFTLVMEVLNMILVKEIKEFENLKYHYRCKELKLTHMCFDDDMLVMFNGDKESMGVVKKALDEFSSVSSLLHNLNKSTIFFGSINDGLKREILQILPFKLGSLPMKYLGIPLVAKRLGVKECMSLMENVEKRINCWRNKLLSYAGRIQLISSVLSSMHQY